MMLFRSARLYALFTAAIFSFLAASTATSVKAAPLPGGQSPSNAVPTTKPPAGDAAGSTGFAFANSNGMPFVILSGEHVNLVRTV